MLHYFALRIESHSLVAAEVSSETAALLLQQAEPIMLGSFSELGALAHRLGLALVTISATFRPAKQSDRTPSTSLVAVA